MRGLVLYGLKHSGKSSLARLISEHYAVPQWDLDDLILKAHPSAESIRQLYRDRGIEWFSPGRVSGRRVPSRGYRCDCNRRRQHGE
jgi:shikimate kinase